ncbi:hypothetical protein E2C01_040347 [Portunus trituberculatus]|uniref:Uncharacterized protein n=1 Tax=Portunus trituberculatus TaxID=210409 RepID=A0A5B7FQJ8_PORTR|nr:hypothetical protein [Portunus trituberculatus]
MNFVTHITIVDNNFEYEANIFLQHLSISSASKVVLSKKKMDKRKVTPVKGKKKTKKNPRQHLALIINLVASKLVPPGQNEISWLH